jgi:hypothetical protein
LAEPAKVPGTLNSAPIGAFRLEAPRIAGLPVRH